MKIESRVEALEHELKILKNEIQATLLEIREQVLNHYYPELRASEPPIAKPVAAKPSESKVSTVRINELQPGTAAKQNARAQMKANGAVPASPQVQVQPFSDLFLKEAGLTAADLEDIELDGEDEGFDTHDDGIDEAMYGMADHEEEVEFEDDIRPTSRASSGAPRMREVNFQQLKQKNLPIATSNGTPFSQAGKATKPTRSNFGALVAWVSAGVASVGKERTLQVVDTYASSGGTLPEATKRSILQLISLANDEAPPTTVGNTEMLGLMVDLDRILSES